MSVRISLFGDFFLTTEKGLTNPGPLERPRAQELVALLLLNPDGVHRATAAAAMWPDSTEVQARTNLRREWYVLKSGHSAFSIPLEADRKQLRLQLPESWSLDATAFDAALARLRSVQPSDIDALCADCDELQRLYVAPLLSTCRSDWLVPERTRRADAYRQAMLFAADHLLHEGDATTATRLARDLVARDACDDASRLVLMRAQHADGRCAAAVAGFHEHAERLKRELELDPGPELMTAVEELLATDSGAASPSSSRSNGNAGLLRSVFASREHELAQLHDAVLGGDDSCEGVRVVFVQGEAGIGKTRLVEEFLQSLEAERLLSIVSRCHAADGELAYRVPAAWIAAPAIRDCIDRLDTNQLSVLARVFPDVFPTSPCREFGPRVRALLFDALVACFTTRAERLILVVDDLHWCDRDSLEWLAYLAREARSRSLAVVATLRTETLPDRPDIVAFARGLERELGFHRIKLGPLDGQAASRLVESNYSGNIVVSPAVFRRSGGNPLFLLEQLAALERGESPDELPVRIHSLIDARLAALPEALTPFLRVAAVHGDFFDPVLIARAADLGPDAALDATEELVSRGLLRETSEGRYVFGHDCIREVAVSSLGAARKRFIHARVALVLAHQHETDVDKVRGLIANHQEQAGELELAYEAYKQASEYAVSRFALQESLQFCNRALALLSSGKLFDPEDVPLHKLTLLQMQVHSLRHVHGFAFSRIGEISREMGALLSLVIGHKEFVQARFQTRIFHSFSGAADKALAEAGETLPLAERFGDVADRIEARRSIAFAQFQLGRYAAAQTTLRSGLRIADHSIRTGELDSDRLPWPVIMSRATDSFHSAVRGRADAARESFMIDPMIVMAHIDLEGRLYPLIGLALSAIAMEDMDRLSIAITAMSAVALACPLERIACIVDMFVGMHGVWNGEAMRAIESMQTAIARYERLQEQHFRPLWFRLLGDAWLTSSQPQKSIESAQLGLTAAGESKEAYCTASLHRLRIEALEVMNASPDVLRAACDTGIRQARQSGDRASLLRILSVGVTSERTGPAAQRTRAVDALRKELESQEALGSTAVTRRVRHRLERESS